MVATLELYLKEEFFQEMEFILPEYGKNIFRKKVELRKLAIEHAVAQMKVMYARQIIIKQHDYCFVLKVDSKMNDDENWLSFTELDKAV